VPKRIDVSCADCYFRQAGLCALQLESPCPTFRHHSRGRLVPPRQPRLVARALARVAAHDAAA
jgi:hypothetical protein